MCCCFAYAIALADVLAAYAIAFAYAAAIASAVTRFFSHYHVCNCPMQLLLLPSLPLVLLLLHVGLPKLGHSVALVSTHVLEVLLQVL